MSTSVSSLEPDYQELAASSVVAPSGYNKDPEETEDSSSEVFYEGTDSENRLVIMEAATRELRRKLQLVKNHISDLVEEDVDSIRIQTVDRDLEKIQEERDNYRSSVEDLLEDFAEELDTAARTTWHDSIASLNRDVKEHARKIRTKVNEVFPPMRPLTEFEKAQLEIQMQQLQLMQSSASRDSDSRTLRESSEKTKTLALAKKKFDAFFEVSEPLVDLSSKYPTQNICDPKKIADHDISALVRKVTAWKNSLRDLTKDYNSFQELTIVHRLAEDLMEKLDLEMETARNAVNDLISVVEKEDKDRNIRTLDSSKVEQRAFKKFGGTPGEDFLHFKKDFEEAVLANRISKSNQLVKLRENLIGEALKQVPKNMTGGLEAACTVIKIGNFRDY